MKHHISRTANAQDVTARQTAGPWIVAWGESADPDRILIQTESGVDVAEAFFTLEQKGCHTGNARLIAAAPEMFKALLWILENDDTGPTRYCTDRDGPAQAVDNAVGKFGERARAAIAKATEA